MGEWADDEWANIEDLDANSVFCERHQRWYYAARGFGCPDCEDGIPALQGGTEDAG